MPNRQTTVSLINLCKKVGVSPVPDVNDATVQSVQYIAHLAANLVNSRNFDVPE